MTNSTPPPPVTYAANMVLFAEMEETTASVLLIKRGHEPCAGRWALPGGRVEADKETSEDAVLRELEEETGIAIHPQDGEVLLSGVYDKPGRDPRGLVVSAAYTATLPACVEPKAGDDAKEARWVQLRDLKPQGLAFDHDRIVRDALALNGMSLEDFR